MRGLVLFVSALIGLCQSSAIPVWELLKKEEKKTFVFSLFAKEVENYCDLLNIKTCNVDLLKYGLGKINELSELELDSLDPYQREAGSLIWNTILSGHKHQYKTIHPKTSTTPKPNSYEDNVFSDNFGFDDLQDNLPNFEDTNVQYASPPEGLIVKLDKISPMMSQLYKLNTYVSINDKNTKKNNEDSEENSEPFIGFRVPETTEERKEQIKKAKSNKTKILIIVHDDNDEDDSNVEILKI